MKTQLENTQEEVAAGVQGVTSGQRGRKRPRKAILVGFAPDLWSGYKARANLPGPGKTDPAGYENKTCDFHHREDSTFRKGELRFVFGLSPRGLR